MRAPLLLVALLPATAWAGPTHHRADAARCAGGSLEVVQGGGKARFRRLDQLPPANEQLTVIRREDGCRKPVIVRYGIGGAHR